MLDFKVSVGLPPTVEGRSGLSLFLEIFVDEIAYVFLLFRVELSDEVLVYIASGFACEVLFWNRLLARVRLA